MRKKVFGVAIGIVMALAISVVMNVDAGSAYAASPKLIESAKAELLPVATIQTVPTKKAVNVKLTAKSKVAKTTKMQGTATLQARYIDKLGKKSGWKDLKSVTVTTTNKTLSISYKHTIPANTKAEYRTKGVVKATKGNQKQTITVYSKSLSY